MKLEQILQGLLVTSSAIAVLAIPAQSLEVQSQKKPRLLNSTQLLGQTPTSSELIQVTKIQINTTDKGFEIILTTPKAEQLQLIPKTEGNTYIADIPKAYLTQPFRQEKPFDGITEVTATNIDGNTIRITVTGTAGVPTVELFDSDEGLIFTFTPATAPNQAQTPNQTEPEQSTSETPITEPSAINDEPIELVVTGEQDVYRASSASAGTRTDTPLRDIPQAIQVIPQQVLEDQKAQRLNDVLRNVAGVSPQNSSVNSFDQFIIRGFGSETTRNGLRDTTNSEVSSALTNVERIEVLKGPASVLYGQGSPGGTINIVTKQPLSEPFYNLETTIGNYDFYSGALDFSGPLNDTKTFLYRLNASVQKSGSFVDFVNVDSYFVSPVFTWQIGKNTTLTLETEYVDTEQKNYTGLPAEGTVLSNPNGKIPINRFIGERSDFYRRSVFRIGYNFEHRFSENWKLQNAFRASFRTYDLLNTFPLGLSDDGRFLNRGGIQSQNNDGGQFRDVYNLDNYFVGKFNTGSIQHELVAGFN
ncbi:TonB-dependent receptor plug domain-containing protein, partial [Nostoc sp. NIES-2111]